MAEGEEGACVERVERSVGGRVWEGGCGREGVEGMLVPCTLLAALLVPKPHPDIALIAPPHDLLCTSTGGVLVRMPGGLQWGGVHHRV